ncbi:MAG: monovalent cation/H(+) antiporter subunit G [Phototrophicaceae bacterium]
MDQILDIIGIVLIFVGVAFCILGVIGILRLPDTYTRLHASGKTSTLGILFLGAGVAFMLPSAIPKIVALSIFIIFSGPVGSHAIAAAVHRSAATHTREALEKGDVSLVESSGIHSGEYIRSVMQQIEDQSQQSSS